MIISSHKIHKHKNYSEGSSDIMAVTNRERVGRALELLRVGLGPFVEREVDSAIKAGQVRMDVIKRFADDPRIGDKPITEWDVAALLKLMWDTWNDIFKKTLPVF